MKFSGSEYIDVHDNTIYGSGTQEYPYRPDILRQGFNDEWLKVASHNIRLKQNLIERGIIYISNRSSKFCVSISFNDNGRLEVNTDAVIEPNDDGSPTRLTSKSLWILYEDTNRISRAFSKSLRL